MLASLRADWRLLKHGKPGSRFEDYHAARRSPRGERSAVRRVLKLALGVLLVVAGPIAGLVPGPGGIVILFLGLALLASELRPVARLLDQGESKLRAAWAHVKRAWKHSASAKVAIVAGLAAMGVCGLYLGYVWASR